MSRLKLVGQRFGKLVVVSEAAENSARGESRWTCKCDCGRDAVIIGRYLTDGSTRSCGCLVRETARKLRGLPEGEASMHDKYQHYKAGAKRRGIAFELTLEDFKSITQQVCFYCGIEPQEIHFAHRINTGYRCNGIDRVDNDLGYRIGNCVPCCSQCNYMKMDYSESEWRGKMEAIGRQLFVRALGAALLDEVPEILRVNIPVRCISRPGVKRNSDDQAIRCLRYLP